MEPVYKVLNPTGTRTAVDCKPCATRLDSLAGKKILYYESEGARNFMPLLLQTLRKDFPTGTFDLVYFDTFGNSTPSDQEKTYQGYIRGVGW